MKDELILSNNPKAIISESIKNIRTNLLFSSVDNEVRSILVTSSMPGEGKSFVSANLAIAFAQIGNRVLVIDADMRRGRQHKIFKVSNDKGLSTLLLDDIDINYKEYIYKTKVENVYILPRGIVPPNPSELLASDKNQQLLSKLEEKFDLIIYDGVPVGGISDSVILADLVDKVVIVSAYKQTSIEILRNTKKSLSKFEDKIAGVVLNKFDGPLKNKYYQYYE